MICNNKPFNGDAVAARILQFGEDLLARRRDDFITPMMLDDFQPGRLRMICKMEEETFIQVANLVLLPNLPLSWCQRKVVGGVVDTFNEERE